MPNLLIEIGVEELPASYIEPAISQFAQKIESALPLCVAANRRSAATPRRLIFQWSDVACASPDSTEIVKGPPRDRALNPDGTATMALSGFLAKCGATMDSLYFDTEKGREYAFVKKVVKGVSTIELAAKCIPDALSSISFPKSMRYNDPKLTFARPVRRLLALFGDAIVEFEWNGVKSGRTTSGHLICDNAPVEIDEANFDSFAEILRQKHVIALSNEREEILRCKMEQFAQSAGYSLIPDDHLLAELVYQLEWPNAVMGSLDDKFMALPKPVLAETLRHHQYSFLLTYADGSPAPAFIAACNLVGQPHELVSVKKGNENVCRARLEDALFFYNEDIKRPLAMRLDELKGVVFHPKLGNYYEKSLRLKALVERLAMSAFDSLSGAEIAQIAASAALLSRCDLVTHMVYELPSLQGVMGTHYALRDNNPPAVARAIEEMYMPKGKGASLPVSEAGILLSLADKFDTLSGFFAQNMLPTATKDPFGLRRATISVISILRSSQISISPVQAFIEALSCWGAFNGRERQIASDFLAYFLDRLWFEMLEEVPHDLCASVHAVNSRRFSCDIDNTAHTSVRDVFVRLDALKEISARSNFASLCTTLERAANITKNFDESGDIDACLFTEDAEIALYNAYCRVSTTIRESLALRSREGYLHAAGLYVATFEAPLHLFFDRVFVNVEDERVRTNRLRLLKRIYLLLSDSFADLTCVASSRNAKPKQ